MLDPDVRFLLANERTLLAWIRTGIALIAGGVALAHLGASAAYEYVVAEGIVLLGAVTVIIGYSRFTAAEEAIRQARLPRRGYGVAVLTAAIAAAALALLAIMIAGTR